MGGWGGEGWAGGGGGGGEVSVAARICAVVFPVVGVDVRQPVTFLGEQPWLNE